MEEPKPHQQKRKRTLEEFQQSPLYKMRVVLKDLRPNFIEVLKTPDFEKCSAAEKIREGMKVMMDLYKEITAECVSLEKCDTVPVDTPGYTGNEQKTVEPREDAKCADDTHRAEGGSAITPDHHAPGTYIVGGSAFGWNFITSSGSKATYYGRSKECFRAANPKSDPCITNR